MIIVVFMRPFQLSVEMKVILNCDSSTLYPLWLGQKTRPKCNTKTNRCSLFPALWAVCLASLIVLIGSFYSCTWDRGYLCHIACQPASPRVRQSKMAPNARNRMASRSFPFGLVHKTLESDSRETTRLVCVLLRRTQW